MIYSDDRKLSLCGWLKEHNKREYDIPLKLQKFLLLYEAFSKVSGDTTDFSYLKGYKKGPVFSNVWGDYTKEREAFNCAVDECYTSGRIMIDQERARKCAFVVSVLSERELSELTHAMNIWKSKEERINSGEYQVILDEADFNEADREMIKMLDRMYPIELVDNSKVVNVGEHYFVFKKEDFRMLKEEHFNALRTLSEKETLFNPVFAEIEEGGRLAID